MLPSHPDKRESDMTRIQNHRLTNHIEWTTKYYSIKHKTHIQTIIYYMNIKSAEGEIKPQIGKF